MESMEDRTMKLSGLPPFPQSLEIAKERRLPHSHRTTTTDISTLQRYGHLNFAATGFVGAKLKRPVSAKLKCPNYPSESEIREEEIGLSNDERTRAATHRGSF
jgi:hypothetical protein